MKTKAILTALALAFWLVPAAPGWAKVRDSIVVRLISHRPPIEAIVLARLNENEGAAAIVVEKTYLGSLARGDRLPLQNTGAIERCTTGISSEESGARHRPFVLFLYAAQPGSNSSYRVGSDWRFDPMVSKCLFKGRPRTWIGGFEERWESLTGLERRIEAGLAARRSWARAWAASDAAERLDLLRPFLIPADETFMAHYDASSLMDQTLAKLDRSDPQTREFVASLLILPNFQKTYGLPGTWNNFGAGRRQRLLRFLNRSE